MSQRLSFTRGTQFSLRFKLIQNSTCQVPNMKHRTDTNFSPGQSYIHCSLKVMKNQSAILLPSKQRGTNYYTNHLCIIDLTVRLEATTITKKLLMSGKDGIFETQLYNEHFSNAKNRVVLTNLSDFHLFSKARICE